LRICCYIIIHDWKQQFVLYTVQQIILIIEINHIFYHTQLTILSRNRFKTRISTVTKMERNYDDESIDFKKARQKEEQKSNGGGVAKSRGESGRSQKLHGYCILCI